MPRHALFILCLLLSPSVRASAQDPEPSLRMHWRTIQPSVPDSSVWFRVIRAQQRQLEVCAERRVGAAASIQVRLEVTDDGRVQDVVMLPAVHGPDAIRSCLDQAFRRLRFQGAGEPHRVILVLRLAMVPNPYDPSGALAEAAEARRLGRCLQEKANVLTRRARAYRRARGEEALARARTRIEEARVGVSLCYPLSVFVGSGGVGASENLPPGRPSGLLGVRNSPHGGSARVEHDRVPGVGGLAVERP